MEKMQVSTTFSMYVYIYIIYTIYTICNISPSIEYVPCDNEINALSYT